jgi:hypothetical protein
MWTRKSNADFCMQSWQRLPPRGHHSTEWFGEKTAIPGIVSKKNLVLLEFLILSPHRFASSDLI